MIGLAGRSYTDLGAATLPTPEHSDATHTVVQKMTGGGSGGQVRTRGCW